MSDHLVNQLRLWDEEELQELPKRLREMYDADDCCEWCEEPKDEPHHAACDFALAADEIERLRAEIDRLSDYCEQLQNKLTRFGA